MHERADTSGHPCNTGGPWGGCAEGEACCFDSQAGSTCRASCAPGQASLCTLGVDGCGEGRDCKPMTGPPLDGVGACVDSPGKGKGKGKGKGG